MSQMIQLNVALPSGHTEFLTALRSSTVQDVRTKAQQAFGKKHLRLISAKSRVLVDPDETLEEAEIEDGECLTALVLQPQLAATHLAFALWCHGDSAVVTWGDAYHGGDSWAVRDQLKGVQQIQATCRGAFAAILADGSVVTWGDAECSGDSSAVRDQLSGVQQIQAANMAFAAILADGSVVTWGHADDYGGDSSAVQDQLCGVQQIQATMHAFAAILADGSVVTWGDADWGGYIRDQLKGVQQIQATWGAFAAILEDGSVVTWGHADDGRDSSAVQDQLKGVQQIQATNQAFAAILADGSVVTWGDAECGGDSLAVQDQLKGVQQIQATNQAFAAILADGSIVTWGDAEWGGDSSAVPDRLKAVQQLQSTRAFEDCGGGSSSAGVWQDAMKSTESFEVISFVTALDPIALMRTNLLERFPLKVTLLGLQAQSKPWSNLRKVELLHQHVAKLPPDKVVFAIDFFDVMWFDCKRDLVETFKSFNRSMVFSAESRPYPISDEALERLERAGGYPLLGERSEPLRTLGGKTYKYLNSGLAENDEERKNMLMGTDDQIAWHTYALHHPDEIALDYDADLFLSALDTEFRNYTFWRGQVWVQPFNRAVCFAHGNGASSTAVHVEQIQELAQSRFPRLQPANCSLQLQKEDGHIQIWEPVCDPAMFLLCYLAAFVISLVQFGHSSGWLADDEASSALLLGTCLVIPVAFAAYIHFLVLDKACNVDLNLVGPGQEWAMQIPAKCEVPVREMVLTVPSNLHGWRGDVSSLLTETHERPHLEFLILDYVAKVGPLEAPTALLLGSGEEQHSEIVGHLVTWSFQRPSP
eukprot:symbB.v1.2.008220.t1/scaffold497.1/size195672/2